MLSHSASRPADETQKTSFMKSASTAEPTYGCHIVWILVIVLSLALRAFLIKQNPSIYAWDAFTRLWEHKSLFVRHWLPLPQLPIVIVSFLHGNLVLLRCIYAIASVFGAFPLGLFVSRYWGKRSGIEVFLLISLLPTFMAFSIVPYQEGFFLLFLGLFLLTFDAATTKPGKGLIVLASLLIACAELCRFEAWAFVFIITCGILLRRQRRLWPILFPAVLIPLIWVLTTDCRDIAYGSILIRKVEPFSWLTVDPNILLSRFNSVARKVFVYTSHTLAWIGLPMLIWGVVISLRKGGIIGRELLIFLFGLLFLAIIRGVNAGGFTSRMPMLFLCIGIVYVVVGLHDVRVRFPHPAGKLFTDGLALALVCLFVSNGYNLAKKSAHFFSPEAQGASLLVGLSKHLSDKDRIIIIPRNIPNAFGESALSAIFANSMKLDPNDSRWMYKEGDIEQREKEAAYVLSFNAETKKYELVEGP